MIWIKRRSEGLEVSSIAVLEYDNAISPYLSVDYSRHFSLVNPASGSPFQVQFGRRDGGMAQAASEAI
jgi:hypothetical protein